MFKSSSPKFPESMEDIMVFETGLYNRLRFLLFAAPTYTVLWIRPRYYVGIRLTKARWIGCSGKKQHNIMGEFIAASDPSNTSYLSHPVDRHFFSGSMKYRFGSWVRESGSFLDMISSHNYCPDRNTKFPKIPLDRSFGWIQRFLELRIAFWIKFSGWLR